MSYHFVDISESGAVLSVKNRQFVCRSKDGNSRSVPLEDVGAVLVTAFSALLHNSFLAGAGAAGIPVVLCERFKPVSIVLPVSRGGDTLLTRAQIAAPARLRKAVWEDTLAAKLANQYTLLETLCPCKASLLASFRACAARRDAAREGNCARIYWAAISAFLEAPAFRREQAGDGLNRLLNYGYGVLLTRVLQKTLAGGLDPMYGVGHAVRERAAPLAYDLMEPFRPAIDAGVVRWAQSCSTEGRPLDVTPAFKQMVHDLLQNRHPLKNGPSLSLDHALDRTVRSLRAAFLSGKPSDYTPWIRKSSKWAG